MQGPRLPLWALDAFATLYITGLICMRRSANIEVSLRHMPDTSLPYDLAQGGYVLASDSSMGIRRDGACTTSAPSAT
jgi:hypothetical protein